MRESIFPQSCRLSQIVTVVSDAGRTQVPRISIKRGQPLRVHDVAEVPGMSEPGAFDVANLPASAVGAGDRLGRRRYKPARLYDLRSTFASNALAAGITMFELARIMGTSAKMIEQHYGTLIDTAHGAILTRLEMIG